MRDFGLRPGTGETFVDDSLGAFRQAAEDMGIALAASDYEMVSKWLQFYSRWPGRRVIGFTGPKDTAVKLLADSFAIRYVVGTLGYGPAIDIGSGNGWPGLALHDREEVLLLDSRKGACDFMRGFALFAGVDKVHVLEARAEEAGRDPSHAGHFGVAVTRAMASPGVASEIAAPFLKVGGTLVLWLGPERENAVTARESIPELGLTLAAVRRYHLPDGMGRRALAVFRRTAPLAPGFPRRMGIMKVKPLF
ncbi:MAG: RsmG family class I SAM-dependent methyltransferase [Bacillota bacterium]